MPSLPTPQPFGRSPLLIDRSQRDRQIEGSPKLLPVRRLLFSLGLLKLPPEIDLELNYTHVNPL
jgi:hypothetical protein